MTMRRLGASEIEVTPIGLGCWQFSNRVGLAGKFWPALPVGDTRAIVEAALDNGINWFDTAEIYGKGASEERLADALRHAARVPGDVVVATKWHPVFRTAANLVRTIGERKRCLGEYPIDLYQIHAPVSFSTIGQETDALARLLDGGHIRTAGISNYFAGQMRRAHRALEKLGHPLVSNQVEYSMLNRRIERNGVLDAAKDLGMTIIAYSPLEQGLLTGKFHEDPALLRGAGLRRLLNRQFSRGALERSAPLVAELKKLAEKYEATSAQVALNWLVTFHGESVVAIPGATKPRQAEQNAGAMRFQLSGEDLERLDALSRAFR